MFDNKNIMKISAQAIQWFRNIERGKFSLSISYKNPRK